MNQSYMHIVKYGVPGRNDCGDELIGLYLEKKFLVGTLGSRRKTLTSILYMGEGRERDCSRQSIDGLPADLKKCYTQITGCTSIQRGYKRYN